MQINAAPQALGFLFQFERALWWLSRCPDNAIVAIETYDDVVVRLKKTDNDQYVFEQDKNTISQRNPFSNQNINLWKTLSNWLKIAYNSSIEVDESIFLLVTNTKVGNCIARDISGVKTEEIYARALVQLKEIAKAPKKNIKRYVNEVFEYSDYQIISVLKKIELIDSQTSGNRKKQKAEIQYNLKISPNLPFEHLYINLLGWLFVQTINKWVNREEACFTTEPLIELSNKLIAEYYGKPFIELAEEYLPIHDNEIIENRNKTFVQQLKKIGINDNGEIIKEITNFLRAKKLKLDYGIEGKISPPDFLKFESDLKNEWNRVSSKYTRLAKGISVEDIGFSIYIDTIAYKGKLCGIVPSMPYTSIGTYHQLANIPELGWHPDWQKIFENGK